MFKNNLALILCLFYLVHYGQDKEVLVKYISEEITIDAVLDESAWAETQPATSVAI